MNKSREMRWEERVARVGVDLTDRDDVQDIGLDGRVILKWILKLLVERPWTELIPLRTGKSDGLL
jgi:hypothetical protein